MRRWPRARTFMLTGLAGLGLLLAAEGLLRLFPDLLPETAQLRLHWQSTEEDIAKIADPETGFMHAPEQAGEVRHRDLAFSWRTDEHGFRNAAAWPHRAQIVAVGDSQTFGFGVDDRDHWVARLDQALPETRVLNLAVNGSAPQQQVRVLRAFADDLEPRLVLFGLFPGNAMGAAGEFQAWLDAGEPEPFPVFRERPNGTPLWKQAIQWGTKQSRVLLFARSLADRLRSPYAGSTLEIDGGEISFAPYIYAGHAEQARPGSPRFDLVLDAVEEAQAFARANGSRFLVVLFPTKEEVYQTELTAPTPEMTAPFARALKARGVPFVDLLPALRDRAAAGERIFLDVDIHPNEQGYALIAQEVLKRLRSRPWSVALEGTSGRPQACMQRAEQLHREAGVVLTPAVQVRPPRNARACPTRQGRGRTRISRRA